MSEPVGPPVVGRVYRVPCVRAIWPNRPVSPGWWPVMGPYHGDGEFFDVAWSHWHVDVRFIRDRTLRHIGLDDYADTAALILTWVSVWPLGENPWNWHKEFQAVRNYEGRHGVQAGWEVALRSENRPRWFQMRKRTCVRDRPARWHRNGRNMHPCERLARAYADSRLGGAAGRICPHRGYDLSSVAVDSSGRLTCPLHGLRFDAATGRCLEGDTWVWRGGRQWRADDLWSQDREVT